MIIGVLKAVNGFAPKTTEQISKILYNSAQAGMLPKTFARLSRQYPQYRGFINNFCSYDPITGNIAKAPTTSNLWELNEVVKIFRKNHRFMNVG